MKEKMTDLQKEVKDSASKIWLAGLGALSLASEEGNKLFKTLVEKGEDFDSREKPPVEAVKKTVGGVQEMAGDVWSRFEESFNTKVAVALQKLGVPTREEIHNLAERVDALTDAIGKLAAETKVESKPAKAETKPAK